MAGTEIRHFHFKRQLAEKDTSLVVAEEEKNEIGGHDYPVAALVIYKPARRHAVASDHLRRQPRCAS
jgi:hypothetical protein